MVLDFGNGDAVERIGLDHAGDEFFGIGGKVGRHEEASVADFLEQASQVIIVEWQRSHQQRV